MNRKNITKLAFAIVILCFFLSTFVSLWSLRIMAKQNMRELSKSLAGRIYDSIGGELSEPTIVARTMANDRFLINMLEREDSYDVAEIEAAMADYLSGIKNGLGCEAAFVVSEASKRYYSFGGLNKQLDLANSARDQWYRQFIETGKAYDLDVDRDEVGQDLWTVFVDARIQGADGGLLGVCGVGLRMAGSQELFVSLEREYGVKIDLVDASGLIHVDTDESRIEKAYLEGINIGGSDDYVFHQLERGRFAVTKYIDRLGWYLVVQSDGSNARGQFINVILLNVVLCAAVLVIMILAIRIIIARTRALSHASFTDQTTQLKNRRAFEEEKARLTMQALKEDFVYVTADLNGLKTANDTLGHVAGDELIRGAADCLRACFGKYGEIYRIGGDEFAAMLHLTPEQMDSAVAALDEAMANWSGNLVGQLSLSCGYASSREFPSENISELSRISDERMYAAKEEYYRQTGRDRRRT